MSDAIIKPLAPIEYRYAGVRVDGVDFSQRLITVIAVPYEQRTKVEYRSEIWDEYFLRGSLDGVVSAPHRVRVNRDHNKTRTVGKATQFWPDRAEGFVAEVRIAKTALGDETLALADEDCLSSSVGFGCFPQDQELDRRTMTRCIKKAYLDHIAFVESPAYSGAKVLDVRTPGEAVNAAGLQPIRTPNLDQAVAELGDILDWTSRRFKDRA